MDVCTEERPSEDAERRCHLQAKERGLGRNHICQRLDVGLVVSRIVRNFISVV